MVHIKKHKIYVKVMSQEEKKAGGVTAEKLIGLNVSSHGNTQLIGINNKSNYFNKVNVTI